MKGLDFLKTEKFVYGLYQSLVFGGGIAVLIAFQNCGVQGIESNLVNQSSSIAGDKVSGQSVQCQVDGRLLKDQESSYFYSKQNPDPGKSCEDYKQSRKCVGGQLTGLSAYHYNQCTDILENGKLVCNSDGVSAVEGAAGKFFSMQYVKSQSECDQYVLDVPCVRQKDHQAGFEFNQNQHFGECKPGAICKDPVDSNKVYQHGDVVIFSNIKNPALGQECSSLNTIPRECYNGEFNKDATYKYSGTNPQSSIGGCINPTVKSCNKKHINLLGQSETISIPNGQTVTYYKTGLCDQNKADFRCDEGVLKDGQGVTVQVNDSKESEYQYDQCVPEGKYCKYDSDPSKNIVVTQWQKPSSADCSEKSEKSCLPGNLRPPFDGFPSLSCSPSGENLAKPKFRGAIESVVSTENQIQIFGWACIDKDRNVAPENQFFDLELKGTKIVSGNVVTSPLGIQISSSALTLRTDVLTLCANNGANLTNTQFKFVINKNQDGDYSNFVGQTIQLLAKDGNGNSLVLPHLECTSTTCVNRGSEFYKYPYYKDAAVPKADYLARVDAMIQNNSSGRILINVSGFVCQKKTSPQASFGKFNVSFYKKDSQGNMSYLPSSWSGSLTSKSTLANTELLVSSEPGILQYCFDNGQDAALGGIKSRFVYTLDVTSIGLSYSSIYPGTTFGIMVTPEGATPLTFNFMPFPELQNFTSPAVNSDQIPVGHFDAIGTSISKSVSGWAYDPDTINAKIEVHFYKCPSADGCDPFQNPDTRLLDRKTASLEVTGEQGTFAYGHRFDGSISQWADATNPYVCAYAINSKSGGGTNTKLRCIQAIEPSTPTENPSQTTTTQNPAVIGDLKGAFEELKISNGVSVLKGWACRPNSTQLVKIHAYFSDSVGNPSTDSADNITYADSYAPIDRSDLASVCGVGNTKHGFEIPIELLTYLGKTDRRIYIWGIYNNDAPVRLGEVTGKSIHLPDKVSGRLDDLCYDSDKKKVVLTGYVMKFDLLNTKMSGLGQIELPYIQKQLNDADITLGETWLGNTFNDFRFEFGLESLKTAISTNYGSNLPTDAYWVWNDPAKPKIKLGLYKDIPKAYPADLTKLPSCSKKTCEYYTWYKTTKEEYANLFGGAVKQACIDQSSNQINDAYYDCIEKHINTYGLTEQRCR